MRIAVLSCLAVAAMTSAVFAASLDELPKLGDAQLATASGGQATAQFSQDSTGFGATENGNNSGGVGFQPSANNVLAGQSSATPANASASFGVMPLAGALAGSTNFHRFGN
ncbi:MAG: hypothetical protein JO010_03465 [Alphaproteobacteria bacterium]|nr:hypothetical protein [Alphaproteobacteria bacterium]